MANKLNIIHGTTSSNIICLHLSFGSKRMDRKMPNRNMLWLHQHQESTTIHVCRSIKFAIVCLLNCGHAPEHYAVYIGWVDLYTRFDIISWCHLQVFCWRPWKTRPPFRVYKDGWSEWQHLIEAYSFTRYLFKFSFFIFSPPPAQSNMHVKN